MIDYRLEKYTSLCRRLLSSEHCDTGGWQLPRVWNDVTKGPEPGLL